MFSNKWSKKSKKTAWNLLITVRPNNALVFTFECMDRSQSSYWHNSELRSIIGEWFSFGTALFWRNTRIFYSKIAIGSWALTYRNSSAWRMLRFGSKRWEFNMTLYDFVSLLEHVQGNLIVQCYHSSVVVVVVATVLIIIWSSISNEWTKHCCFTYMR